VVLTCGFLADEKLVNRYLALLLLVPLVVIKYHDRFSHHPAWYLAGTAAALGFWFSFQWLANRGLRRLGERAAEYPATSMRGMIVAQYRRKGSGFAFDLMYYGWAVPLSFGLTVAAMIIGDAGLLVVGALGLALSGLVMWSLIKYGDASTATLRRVINGDW
jgi:hypothetical protein